MSYLGQGLGLGREERFTATATAGQTSVTVDDTGRSISYTPNHVDVYLNGVKMVNGSDITVTSGTSIVFASALAAGDSVDVVAPGYFQPADTVSRSLGGTFLGAVNLPSGGLNVGSGQLKVDSSGRVTMSGQPTFSAVGGTDHNGNGGWVSSLNPMKFPSGNILVNNGGHMNSATGIFTCPVAGIYECSGSVLMGQSGYAQLAFRKNGVAGGAGSSIHENNLGTGYATIGSTVYLSCAQNDQITFGDAAGYSGTSIYVSAHGAVSIRLVG